MTQHRKATSSGQDSAVCLGLQASSHPVSDADVHILDREGLYSIKQNIEENMLP